MNPKKLNLNQLKCVPSTNIKGSNNLVISNLGDEIVITSKNNTD